MKVLILLLVATCAVLSAKAGDEKQNLQQQSPLGQPQNFLQGPQQGLPQGQPQSFPEEEQQEGPQHELSENPVNRPSPGLFQETPEGLFQGPQKGDQNKQRPGPPGPHPGPLGPRPGPSRPLLPPPPVFNNYTTWQLNDIVNRIMRDSFMFRAKMSDKGMNGHCVIDHIRAMFVGYNVTLKTVEEKFSSCVTDDMKALPEKAITEIISCLPTRSELETKKDESKAAFDALLEKLKAADKEISAMTDDTQKHIKIAKVEWSDVYQFYLNKADKMFKAIQTIESCLTTQRSSIHDEAIKNLEELETCIQQ